VCTKLNEGKVRAFLRARQSLRSIMNSTSDLDRSELIRMAAIVIGDLIISRLSDLIINRIDRSRTFDRSAGIARDTPCIFKVPWIVRINRIMTHLR